MLLLLGSTSVQVNPGVCHDERLQQAKEKGLISLTRRSLYREGRIIERVENILFH